MRIGWKEVKARIRAFRNRWCHPDLAIKYWRADNDFARLGIAQDMMRRDRASYTKKPSGREYPIEEDYHIQSGLAGWNRACAALRSREVELRRGLQQLRPGRR